MKHLMMRRLALTLLVLVSAWVTSGCSTTHATYKNVSGDNVMLLGYDPVAYHKEGKPIRGTSAYKHAIEDRTYWFTSAESKASFVASPEKFEPQYGGFCANGAVYGMKWASNPTSFEILDGKLYIFSGWGSHASWTLHKRDNVAHADREWKDAAGQGWRMQSVLRMIWRVPHYRSNDVLNAEWQRRFPNDPKPASQNGGFWANFTKSPGWQATEGFGQPALGWPD
jgi:YHS domain-containing protein